jgi:hypothetical protein
MGVAFGGSVMRFIKLLLHCATLGAGLLSAGCAVPFYDVPNDAYGQPTVKTIVERLECEIRDMVRDDRPDDPATFNSLFLLNGDYDVQIALSLEVNDSGGLAPSVTYVAGLTGPSTVSWSAGGSISEARDHTFGENIQLSVRKIYLDWKSGHKAYDCPLANTNLAGTLGLKDIVALAASTPELVDPVKSPDAGVFGGTIQFVVTKSVTSAGPTFALVHFTNIAALGNLSEINTDKITLAFAHGPNVGKRMPPITLAAQHNRSNATGSAFLQQLLTSSITSQLIVLQKSLRQ